MLVEFGLSGMLDSFSHSLSAATFSLAFTLLAFTSCTYCLAAVEPGWLANSGEVRVEIVRRVTDAQSDYVDVRLTNTTSGAISVGIVCTNTFDPSKREAIQRLMLNAGQSVIPVFVVSKGAIPSLEVSFKSKDVLSVAKNLASGRYKGYTYGSPKGKKKIDCVSFVLAVVEVLNGGDLDPKTRARILISDVKEEDLQKLVEDDDVRIKGVQQALVDAGKGKLDKTPEVGSLVQYWYKVDEDSDWEGHAGIITKVYKNGRVDLYGAHESKNGIDYLTNMSLEGKKTFYVHWSGD